jgi:MOSC domain-containing protein YiiM
MSLVARPRPAWTVARAAGVMHHHKHDLALAAELAALPELSATWHATLSRRAGSR